MVTMESLAKTVIGISQRMESQSAMAITDREVLIADRSFIRRKSFQFAMEQMVNQDLIAKLLVLLKLKKKDQRLELLIPEILSESVMDKTITLAASTQMT